MKLPDKWTKLQLESFHNNDAISVAIKLHQLIDYLAEREEDLPIRQVPILINEYTGKGSVAMMGNGGSQPTPLFKADDVQYSTDSWNMPVLIFKTKAEAEQAREALLKLTK